MKSTAHDTAATLISKNRARMKFQLELRANRPEKKLHLAGMHGMYPENIKPRQMNLANIFPCWQRMPFKHGQAIKTRAACGHAYNYFSGELIMSELIVILS